MYTVENYGIIHLRLNYIDVLEAVILLMTYLIEYVSQKNPEDLNPSIFNKIT